MQNSYDTRALPVGLTISSCTRAKNWHVENDKIFNQQKLQHLNLN